MINFNSVKFAPIFCLDTKKLVNGEMKHASNNNQKGFNDLGSEMGIQRNKG